MGDSKKLSNGHIVLAREKRSVSRHGVVSWNYTTTAPDRGCKKAGDSCLNCKKEHCLEDTEDQIKRKYQNNTIWKEKE